MNDLFVIRDDARLLVADDDPILREFASTHLSTPSVTVETAFDGEDAWGKLQAQPFDIALIDLGMPRLDGFGLIERVRADARLSHLPIVVITGREDMAAIDRAYTCGATSFVVKPLNWRLLSHQLGYVLRSSRNEAAMCEARVAAERAGAVKANLLRLMRHEFNTPFNAILGFGRLIEAHAQDEAARSHAAQILVAARRFRSTLDDLATASTLLAGGVEARRGHVIARDVLRQAARSALERAGSVADLSVRDRTDAAELHLDLDLTIEALRRLIVNAFQHGVPPVGVTAQLEPDGALTLLVEDAATTFDPAALAPVLGLDGEPPAARRGLGIGLDVVRACCAAHGGTFEIAAGPSGGACARIRIPRAAAAPAQDQRAIA